MPKDRTCREEGRQAFAEGKTTKDLPYSGDAAKENDWLHGWWGALYQQRDEDIKRITDWLDNNATRIYSEGHCKAIAEIIVCNPDYDRTKPIENNLGGYLFTIPAPATLKGPRR